MSDTTTRPQAHHLAGTFRAFRVRNGISLVVVNDGVQRRVHLRRQDNPALFDFLAAQMQVPT